MYMRFEILNISIFMLLFNKPMCVFYIRIRFLNGCTRKATYCVRISKAFHVKQHMRTKYGFARKATYCVQKSTALRVKRLMRLKQLIRTRYGFCA